MFQLKEPLEFTADIDDGMCVYHNPQINLWGYGDRPDDALRDLHENFAYLWDEVAQDQDELLDDKALEVKHAILELVAGQPIATDA